MKKQLLGMALIVILTSAYASGEGAATRWKTIYTFTGGNDGEYPVAPLVADSHGNLYGTTADGGGSGVCDHNGRYPGCGTVFELIAPSSPSGTWRETILHAFTGSDGAAPVGALIFDAAGNLYGTTEQGGDLGNTLCANVGCGTVFELSPPSGPGSAWTETVLHEFEGEPNDGQWPESSLIFDSAGNLYGTTATGGSNSECINCGVIFELSPEAGGTWTESIIYSFMSAVGFGENTPLVSDGAGGLYGTSPGTVFQLVPPIGGGSWMLNVLFDDLSVASGILLVDPSGNLFGTTYSGGPQQDGIAFELIPPQSGGSWTEVVLSSFRGGSNAHPYGFVQDASGNLYGTTEGNAYNAAGQTFKLSSSAGEWNQTILHSFSNTRFAQGYFPQALLVYGKWNALYGTTSQGGDETCGSGYGCGTVFGLLP